MWVNELQFRALLFLTSYLPGADLPMLNISLGLLDSHCMPLGMPIVFSDSLALLTLGTSHVF